MTLRKLMIHPLLAMAIFLFATGSIINAEDPIADKASESNTASDVTSTLGMAPPEDAVILFDGSNFDAWKPFSFGQINPRDDQKEIQWNLVDDKAMEISFEFKGKQRKQFICTKQKFGDYRLHLEFQLPQQGSGNSGVFFGPMYEIQILNSAAKEKPGLSDCGAIYQIRRPDEQAALPPGKWQTIDLEFQAARFNIFGYMTESSAARVTVRLNGKLIHNDFKLSLRRNKYATYPEEPLSPIILQDHGAKVKFRNIWVEEKNVTKKEKPDSSKSSELRSSFRKSPFRKTSSSKTLKQKQPNFVVIFTDDQGYGDLSCFGGENVSTPRIDQMAAEGSRLAANHF